MDMRNAMVATWDASSPARRRWLVVFAVFLAALALVAALRPLPAAIARAESEVGRTRSLLDVAQARIADNESLARTAAPLRAGDLRSAIDGVMARHELRAAPVPSASTEGRYSVVVDDVRFDTRGQRCGDDADASIACQHVECCHERVEPGRVRADLTFAR